MANRHGLRRDRKRRESENQQEWFNLIADMVDEAESDSSEEDWEGAGFSITENASLLALDLSVPEFNY